LSGVIVAVEVTGGRRREEERPLNAGGLSQRDSHYLVALLALKV
jgi:hypothetical protein